MAAYINKYQGCPVDAIYGIRQKYLKTGGDLNTIFINYS